MPNLPYCDCESRAKLIQMVDGWQCPDCNAEFEFAGAFALLLGLGRGAKIQSNKVASTDKEDGGIKAIRKDLQKRDYSRLEGATEKELESLTTQFHHVQMSLEDGFKRLNDQMMILEELENEVERAIKERRRIEQEKKRLEEIRIREERERLEKERLEKERIENEKREKERIERELQEKQRVEQERIENERKEKERQEQERIRLKEEKRKAHEERTRIEKEQAEIRQKEKEKRRLEEEEKARLNKAAKEERQREHAEREKARVLSTNEHKRLKSQFDALLNSFVLPGDFVTQVNEMLTAGLNQIKQGDYSLETELFKNLNTKLNEEELRLAPLNEQRKLFQNKLAELEKITKRLLAFKTCPKDLAELINNTYATAKDHASKKGKFDYEAALEEISKLPELMKAERERQAEEHRFQLDAFQAKFNVMKTQVTKKMDPKGRLSTEFKKLNAIAIEAIKTVVPDVAPDDALDAIRRLFAGFEDLIEEARREKEEIERQKHAEKDAEDYKSFKANDRSTWSVQPLVAEGIPLDDLVVNESDKAKIKSITECELVNHSVGSPTTGIAYHAHMINNGTGGISYAYNHLGGKRVQPVIYDYATHRVENTYDWKLGGGRKCPTSAALPKYVKSNRPPEKV